MARYSEFTTKQLEVLEPLTKEAAHWKKKYEDIELKLAEKVITMDFEENKRLRKLSRDFRRKYEDLQAEINNIISAREEYEYCKKKADSYCKRAVSLQETWGF